VGAASLPNDWRRRLDKGGLRQPGTARLVGPRAPSWGEQSSADAFERIAGLVDRLAHQLEGHLDADIPESNDTAELTDSR
jgi:hypothetical protein